MFKRAKALATLIPVAALLVFTPLAAEAQQAGKVYRIGYMATDRVNPDFRQAFSELGYVEGKNLSIEWSHMFDRDQYSEFAKQLVALNVDLILSTGVSATRAAKQATSTIPIVMGNSSADPVQLGLIDSLARPGGNVTGVFDLLSDLAGKRMELLKEIFPQLSRVAHFSPSTVFARSAELSPVGQAHLRGVKASARALGVQIQPFTVKGFADVLERDFQAAIKKGAEASIIVGTDYFTHYRKEIVNLALSLRLPTMHTHRGWVELGGLISYTTDPKARYRRAAWYVDQIFKGVKPADLPVEQPKKYLLEVNLKTAWELGITIPQSIMLRATKVIE